MPFKRKLGNLHLRRITMAHKLTLTRKYQIIEYRDGDEDLANELTDDATIKVFDALENLGVRPVCSYSEHVDDLQYDDFVFILSDFQLATLKETVNLKGFDFYEVEED